MSQVIGIISLVAGLAGSVQAANAQKQAGEAQKEAYEFNARISDENARQTREKAMWDESASREESRAQIAKMMAMYAKSGVALDKGSPLLIMAKSAEDAEKDALAIRWMGDVNATEYENQATLNRFYGRNAKKTGNTQANTTLLQGIGNAGMAYGQGKNSWK